MMAVHICAPTLQGLLTNHSAPPECSANPDLDLLIGEMQ